MPIYEYGCRGCKIIIERILPRPHVAIRCPHCGEVAERIPSLTGYRRDHTWD